MKTILSLALLAVLVTTNQRHTHKILDSNGGIIWIYNAYHDGAAEKEFTCGWVWLDPNDKSWHAAAWPDPHGHVFHYHTRKAGEQYVEQWCKP